jgi:hypothetical protein
MTNANPFRYFRTSPEIIRLVVMMFAMAMTAASQSFASDLRSAAERAGIEIGVAIGPDEVILHLRNWRSSGWWRGRICRPGVRWKSWAFPAPHSTAGMTAT